jgi:hypothetical protein
LDYSNEVTSKHWQAPSESEVRSGTGPLGASPNTVVTKIVTEHRVSPGPEEKANKIPLFMNHSRLPQVFEQDRSSLRSRSSHDSDDSLAALELLEGAAPTAHHRARSLSLSGSNFGFERDLLPLSASLSESEEVRSAVGEKTIGLINGTLGIALRLDLD